MRISKNTTTALLAALILLVGWTGRAHAASTAGSEERINAVLAAPNVPEAYKRALRKHLKDQADKKAAHEKMRRERRSHGKGSGASSRAGIRKRLYKVAGGIVRGSGGVQLIIPPDALPSDMRVSLGRPARAQDASRAAKMAGDGLRGVSRAVALGPEATALAVPATVVFPYDPTKLNGLKEAELKIHAWNQTLGTWEQLPSKVDADKKAVSAQVSRLTTVQLLGGGAGNR